MFRDGEVVALMRNGLLEALLSDIDRNGTKATTLTVSLEGLLLRVDRYKTATFERVSPGSRAGPELTHYSVDSLSLFCFELGLVRSEDIAVVAQWDRYKVDLALPLLTSQ